MSVIAWDGKTLAADKRASFGTTIRTTTKIFRHGNALLAYAGDSAHGEEVRAWWMRGADPDDFPRSQRDKDDWAGLLVIRRGEHGPVIARYERTPYPIYFEDEHFSIGSGREFALAAMYLGCDARRAVEVACALDSGCGNGIDTLTLEDTPAPSGASTAGED
jgi:20S proteasome alpha/beta subunit